jgi:hypothetical protein
MEIRGHLTCSRLTLVFVPLHFHRSGLHICTRGGGRAHCDCLGGNSGEMKSPRMDWGGRIGSQAKSNQSGREGGGEGVTGRLAPPPFVASKLITSENGLIIFFNFLRFLLPLRKTKMPQ